LASERLVPVVRGSCDDTINVLASCSRIEGRAKRTSSVGPTRVCVTAGETAILAWRHGGNTRCEETFARGRNSLMWLLTNCQFESGPNHYPASVWIGGVIFAAAVELRLAGGDFETSGVGSKSRQPAASERRKGGVSMY